MYTPQTVPGAVLVKKDSFSEKRRAPPPEPQRNAARATPYLLSLLLPLWAELNLRSPLWAEQATNALHAELRHCPRLLLDESCKCAKAGRRASRSRRVMVERSLHCFSSRNNHTKIVIFKKSLKITTDEFLHSLFDSGHITAGSRRS